MAPNRKRVAIVGGGISGIAQAVRLEEALGNKVKFTIYERDVAIGGVWRDSLWKGAGVDVPIHLYSLYSHLHGDFSEKYARRDEVLAYWNSIIDKHGFRDRFRFEHDFQTSSWDEIEQVHHITFNTPTGPVVIDADVLIAASGALNKPIIPSLPGIDSFQGLQWHSSRWNTAVDLSNKRVAVVGNGSSGIQAVPYIAGLEGIQLTQFMRSPGYWKPKVNFQYSWLQRFIFKYVPFANRLYRWNLFYSYDHIGASRGTGKWSTEQREGHTARLLGYLHKTAPKEYHDILTPHYPMHCKRVAYNAGWLEALHLPNVHLTADPITAVTSTGLVTKSGASHDFDIIVWATGFDVSATGVGLNHGVYGLDGKELRELWEDNEGAFAYLGVGHSLVPNYFTVLGPNAISMSWGYTLGNQTEFIARLIKGIVKNGLTSIVPKAAATSTYNLKLQERLEQTVLVSKLCTAWYRYRGYGKVIAPSGLTATELWLRTRKIKWEDWEARTQPEGADKAAVVEVRSPTSWNPFSWVADWAADKLENYIYVLTTSQ